jgi:hypothetical protein
MSKAVQKKNGVTEQGFISRTKEFGRRYIDYRMGLLGSIFMAVVVFLVNYFHHSPILGSLTAAIKQGLYTLMFGGFIMKGCENLAVKIPKRSAALIAATLIPSFIAITLTFIVHSLRGTPHPVESTLPTAFGIFPTTAIWGITKRKKNLGD